MSEGWPVKFLWFLILLLCGLGAWMLGRYQGTQNAVNLATAQAASSVNQASLQRIAYLEQELSTIQANLNSVNTENKALSAKSVHLEKALETSLTEALEDSHALDLYRRIENSDAPPQSISIEKVEIQSTKPLSLNLTLVQWRGRERVAGQISALADQRLAEDKAVLSRHKSLADPESYRPVNFDFRFFQSVSVPVFVDTDEPPDFIQIHVQPDDKTRDPLVKRIAWTELAGIVD
jgi:hypothetical protein